MTDDRGRSQLVAQLRRWLDETMSMAEPYRKALRAALEPGEASPPWTARFCNLPTVSAVLKYLNEESPSGATAGQIRDALMEGGAGYNSPNFERDLKNSLSRSSKSGVLVKQGEKYLPGKKRPAHLNNRHERKPLK